MKIPSYDNFQVGATGQPGVGVQAPSGPTPGSITADSASKFGQTLMTAGDAGSKMILAAQEKADLVRINDARNQLSIAQQDLTYNKETGFLAKKGRNVFLNDQGMPLEKPLDMDYGEKFRERIEAITGTLGSDRQKEMFRTHAGSVAAQFGGQLQQHTLVEFGKYSDKTNDDTYKLEKESAVQNFNNPNLINEGIGRAMAAIEDKAMRNGADGKTLEAARFDGKSEIHRAVISAALSNKNATYADAYYKKALAAGEINANDNLSVIGHITDASEKERGLAAVNAQASATMPMMAPDSFDRLKATRTHIESGGKDFKPDGTPQMSTYKRPDGSIGHAWYKHQVTDDTAKDPGYGIKPAFTRSPEEYNRIGDELLKKLSEIFPDPIQALAAYHSGEGAVKKAIASAAQHRDGNGDWVAYLGPNGRDYVAKSRKLMNEDVRSIIPKPTAAEFTKAAVERLGPGASASLIERTKEIADKEIARIHRDSIEKGDQAGADALRYMQANGSLSTKDLPIEQQDALRIHAPEKIAALNAFAKKEGAVESNMSLYMKLSNAKYLDSLTNNELLLLRTELSAQHFQHFIDQKAALTNGANNNPGTLNTGAINSTLQARFRTLQLDPTPKDGTPQAAHMGAVQEYINTTLTDAQKTAGKKFNDVETATHIDKLFAGDIKFKGMFGSISSKNMMSISIGDIPSDLKHVIRMDLAKKGNYTPLDAHYLAAYYELQAASAAKAAATVQVKK